MIDLVGALHDQLEAAADDIAERVVGLLTQSTAPSAPDATVDALVRRGRVLLPQGAASVLADRLGDALLGRVGRGGSAGDDALRAAIERTRVGAVADVDGTIHRRTDR